MVHFYMIKTDVAFKDQKSDEQVIIHFLRQKQGFGFLELQKTPAPNVSL
jgi:hypothetical protein